jgi:hypothetical protein
MMERALEANRPYAEQAIWGAVAKAPQCLGRDYSRALAIHQVQLGNQSGYVDLILLPRGGGKKLVIVEAKHARDRRSSADVIGQLLKYYAHALDLGAAGLASFMACAQDGERGRRASRLLSFKAVMKCHSLKAAAEKARNGARLRSSDVQLIVAVDTNAAKFTQRLLKVADLLRTAHGVPIGVVEVGKSTTRWLCPAKESAGATRLDNIPFQRTGARVARAGR